MGEVKANKNSYKAISLDSGIRERYNERKLTEGDHSSDDQAGFPAQAAERNEHRSKIQRREEGEENA